MGKRVAPSPKMRAERLVRFGYRYGDESYMRVEDSRGFVEFDYSFISERDAIALRRILAREFRRVADARTRRIVAQLRTTASRLESLNGCAVTVAAWRSAAELVEALATPKRKAGAK
jgi:hypothetical protein